MELIYPEFLRFKDRVAVPYTALCQSIGNQQTHCTVNAALFSTVGAAPTSGTNMHDCWNWETGMTKDHVSKGVRVRVPYCALGLLLALHATTLDGKTE